jgi:hypothetical protein
MTTGDTRSLDSILDGSNTSNDDTGKASGAADAKPDADTGTSSSASADDAAVRDLSDKANDDAVAKAAADKKAADDAAAAAAAAPKDDAKKDDQASALTVMRKELQEAQRKLRELEQRGEKKEPVKAPDPVEDPDGYDKYMDQKIEAQTFNAVAKISERTAIKTYGKEAYDAAVDAFEEAVKADPSLAKQLRDSDDPAEFAYQHGRQVIDRGGVNVSTADAVAAAEKRARDEMAKTIEAEVKKRVDAAIAAALPKSLAEEQSSGGGKSENPATNWAGPAPLTDIFGEKKRR